MILDFKEFDNIYQNTVHEIFRFWTPQMQDEIASHCHGWKSGLFDFERYLKASSIRYYYAYKALATPGGTGSICDLGGFFGVFPVTMKALGYDVTMTESLKYYSDSFEGLFSFIRERGVQVVDYDPFHEYPLTPGVFDAITVMAVLEHYPHSLQTFIRNIASMVKPAGKLYIEVPNIAFWPRRMSFLFGHTPLSSIGDIFRSKVPYIGHHHEFTISELRTLADLGGLSIMSENYYNYSPGTGPCMKMLLRRPLQFFAFLSIKSSRECLAVLCRVKEAE
jgi:2-polyprenyl-3-methyl-5-hydroxy-6-metoxy-1,4-benzoquinol methylase